MWPCSGLCPAAYWDTVRRDYSFGVLSLFLLTVAVAGDVGAEGTTPTCASTDAGVQCHLGCSAGFILQFQAGVADLAEEPWWEDEVRELARRHPSVTFDLRVSGRFFNTTTATPLAQQRAEVAAGRLRRLGVAAEQLHPQAVGMELCGENDVVIVPIGDTNRHDDALSPSTCPAGLLIWFRVGSATMDAAPAWTGQLMAKLQEYPTLKVEVQGVFLDPPEPASVARARRDAVVAWLTKSGVGKNRIVSVGPALQVRGSAEAQAVPMRVVMTYIERRPLVLPVTARDGGVVGHPP